MPSYEEKLAAGRIGCCVIGCRRTFKVEDGAGEVMCGVHWRMARRQDRTQHAHIWRQGKATGWPASLVKMEAASWARIKAQVIGKAVGL